MGIRCQSNRSLKSAAGTRMKTLNCSNWKSSFPKALVLQRQFVLAREDEFLFVGDAVCHHEPDSMLGLRVELNAADGIQMTEEAENERGLFGERENTGIGCPCQPRGMESR